MVLFNTYSLDQTHYIGIGGLAISSLLYFTKRKIYVYIFGLILVAGLFGLLDFFYVNMTTGFGDLKFNPIFLILMILFFAFNREIIGKVFPEKGK